MDCTIEQKFIIEFRKAIPWHRVTGCDERNLMNRVKFLLSPNLRCNRSNGKGQKVKGTSVKLQNYTGNDDYYRRVLIFGVWKGTKEQSK